MQDSSQIWTEEKETLTSRLEQLQKSYKDLVKKNEKLAQSLQVYQTLSEENKTLVSAAEQLKQASHQDNTHAEEESNLKLTQHLNEVLSKLAFVEEEKNRQKEILAARDRELDGLESTKTKLNEDLNMAAENITSLQQKITRFETELENVTRINLELKKNLDKVKSVSMFSYSKCMWISQCSIEKMHGQSVFYSHKSASYKYYLYNYVSACIYVVCVWVCCEVVFLN